MIVVAPDKFKGSLSAASVASVVATELRAANPQRPITELPISDGGDGTVDLAIRSGMDRITTTVTGPLGKPTTAAYARGGDTAVIEMASAAGLTLLRPEPGSPPASANAGRASTFGVGELIEHAVVSGARTLIVGLGGSASTDGGAGLAIALGATVTDSAGYPVPLGGCGLGAVAAVNLDPMVRMLDGVEIVLASDVDNPLTGPDGAAAVYGPQKGADPPLVELFDRHLAQWADVLHRSTGVDVSAISGAGAAGGTGAPLLAAGCARIRSGVEVMSDLFGLSERLRSADVVIVGEGALDRQSLRGKGPVGVARLARSNGATVFAVVGTYDLTDSELDDAAIDRVYAMTEIEPDRERCMQNPEPILRSLAMKMAAEIGTDVAAGDPR